MRTEIVTEERLREVPLRAHVDQQRLPYSGNLPGKVERDGAFADAAAKIRNGVTAEAGRGPRDRLIVENCLEISEEAFQAVVGGHVAPTPIENRWLTCDSAGQAG